MKTIGIIGGLTWVSSLDYYRLLNQLVNYKLGGAEAAKIILYSVNFGEIKTLTETGNWKEIAIILTDAAKKIEQCGAGCLMIGANTMHKIADEVQAAVSIPLIHIAVETARSVSSQKLKKVALLGTKYTMQMDFYKNKLAEAQIDTIIPNEEDINYINTAIYRDMHKGFFPPEMKAEFMRIINDLIGEGAEGIILGCTEIPILIKQSDCTVPVFDTTEIHAKAAVAFALQDE
ncbi:MAG: aspartate/glutamate racemase family protein [Chitinophagaceae bacterium]|nr:aspartate/glutamate racemase family protein [Chitinophagaceae bacterium]